MPEKLTLCPEGSAFTNPVAAIYPNGETSFLEVNQDGSSKEICYGKLGVSITRPNHTKIKAEKIRRLPLTYCKNLSCGWYIRGWLIYSRFRPIAFIHPTQPVVHSLLAKPNPGQQAHLASAMHHLAKTCKRTVQPCG